MDQPKDGIQSIDDYIANFPDEIQSLLQAVRATIRAAAPDAHELISYGMPAFAQNGNLVYFAALKNHIGLYPTAAGISAVEEELATYEHSKGSVKFPTSQPLPMELISKIVRVRVAQNLSKPASRGRKTKGIASA